MKLDDLKLFPHRAGFQHKELFDNGYGISVVPENNLGEDPLYEVAVLSHNDDGVSRVCYTSGVTSDIIRFCTVDAVDSLIERIRNLSPAS